MIRYLRVYFCSLALYGGWKFRASLIANHLVSHMFLWYSSTFLVSAPMCSRIDERLLS